MKGVCDDDVLGKGYGDGHVHGTSMKRARQQPPKKHS